MERAGHRPVAALFFGLVRAAADQMQLSPHIEQANGQIAHYPALTRCRSPPWRL